MQQLPRAEMLPIDGTARLDTTNKGSMEQWRQVTTALNAERRSTPPEKLVWAHPYSTSRALSRNTATANAMELVVELVESPTHQCWDERDKGLRVDQRRFNIPLSVSPCLTLVGCHQQASASLMKFSAGVQ
jgi:hypothetical protein